MDSIRTLRQTYPDNYKWLINTFKHHGFSIHVSTDESNAMHVLFTKNHFGYQTIIFWYPNGKWNTKKECGWIDRYFANKAISKFKSMVKTHKKRKKLLGNKASTYQKQLDQSHKQESDYEHTIKYLRAQLNAKKKPTRQKYLVIYNASLENIKPDQAHLAYTVLCSNAPDGEHPYVYGFHLADLLNNCHNKDPYYKKNIWLTESQILQLDFGFKHKEVIPVDDHLAKNVKGFTKNLLTKLIDDSLKK